MADACGETMVLGGDIGEIKTNLGLFAKGQRNP